MRVESDPQGLKWNRAAWHVERKRLLRVLRQVRAKLVDSGGGKCHFSRSTLNALRNLRRDRGYLPDAFWLERVANLCLDRGWAEHAAELLEAVAYVNTRNPDRVKPWEPPPASAIHAFIPDDMDPEEEAVLMQDPARRASQAMIAHIRLNRDPEEVSPAVTSIIARCGLRQDIRDLRDALDLSQPGLGEACGLSTNTLSRMENLGREGAYLPHASTLRKLAALCRERGWPERATALERAAGWERRHRYPERKDSRGD